jgi:hypothetical protein
MMISDDEAKEWVANNQHVFKAVTKSMKLIDALEHSERESAAIMIVANIVMHCCNSEDDARHAIAHIANRSAMAVAEFSDRGLCAWNATRQ